MLKIGIFIAGGLLLFLIALDYYHISKTDWNKVYAVANSTIQQYHLNTIDQTNPIIHMIYSVGLPQTGFFIGGMLLALKKA